MTQTAKGIAEPVAVLCGGRSAEREVSLRSGAAVLKALQQRGYRALALDAAEDLPDQLRRHGIATAFLALHGRQGEDGTVQGLLEIMGIPYTGSGVLASALAMDKAMAKQIVAAAGVVTPAARLLEASADEAACIAFCQQQTRWPCVVKPVREGSTLGISLVRQGGALAEAVAQARRYDRRVLVEDYIAGREVTVAVLCGEALPIVEVQAPQGFYDYQAKYTPGQTNYLVPAPLEAGCYRAIQQAAVRSSQALGCRGAVRIDFMVAEEAFYFLEANTIPGMTETSLLPKAAACAGMDFADLVERLLADASLDR
ncbi:MAG: D-alanine--D-alanine ligase [Desulfuromonas thiophila]|nr:D-alanine--D-alanine ligase [Desulfuromonas thiophila]MDD3802053.1 D-alanine--D-alanine ligase [Desulfuromonas thiophila]